MKISFLFVFIFLNMLVIIKTTLSMERRRQIREERPNILVRHQRGDQLEQENEHETEASCCDYVKLTVYAILYSLGAPRKPIWAFGPH